MAFEEFHRFIDDAVENRKLLGEARMMIQRAWGVIIAIESSEKNKPAWMSKQLEKLKEVLTYEPRD